MQSTCACGRPAVCKDTCHRCYLRNYRNRDGKKDAMRAWRKKYMSSPEVRAKVNEYQRLYQKPYRKHGISREKFEQLLSSGCAICGKTTFAKGEAQIDHDHEHCRGTYGCNVCVRAVLCSGCNRLIGHAQENESILAAAIFYLNHYKSMNRP